jgi:phage repressor protein C with HTH and peptisase S24 domain
MKTTKAQRVSEFLSTFKLSQSALARAIGVTQSTISSALKSASGNVNDEIINGILNEFSSINPLWLTTGEGEMLLQNAEQSEQHKDEEAHTEQVPLLPLAAFAGPIDSFYKPGVTRQECDLINAPFSGIDMAIPISGDSMEPVFTDGSIVFIKKIDDRLFIPWGQALVLDTANGAFLKIVLPDDKSDKFIIAKSFNPKYPPMRIPTTAIYGMYRILNVSKTFTTM